MANPLSGLDERRAQVRQEPENPFAYIRLAGSYMEANRYPEALAVYAEGLARCAPSRNYYSAYIYCLKRCNRAEAAAELAARGERVLATDADRAVMRMERLCALPILYDSTAEIERRRGRFAEELAAVCRETALDTAEARASALAAVSAASTYYLSAQGYNDRELHRQYGQLLGRVAAANFPQWRSAPPLTPADKLRVGYVSSFFRKNSLMKSHLGWLQEHRRDRFEIYTYYVREETDAVTREVEQLSTGFRHIPGDVAGACAAVARDGLHVVVYLDIGLYPATGVMAASRLAPVQCTTWGNPATSGLETVDYYLSSSLMEPADGDAHYSERLVRLPGIGVWYRKPLIPRPLLRKTRADFGLRAEDRVYLCCHAVHTHLPQHDGLYAAIAARVPAAQFVFVSPNDLVTAQLAARLERAFQTQGLRAADCCRVLPLLSEFDYWNLNLLADVYLDTPAWSGCNTTMEAIACGLPVVTLPGRFLRGRHSAAILTQLGVTETIAGSEEEYVDLAVRAGTDAEWHAGVAARMQEGFPRLYGDRSCTGALEAFYEHAVEEAAAKE